MIKNGKNNSRLFLKGFLMGTCLILGITVPIISTLDTSDYKLDKLSYQIVDYNEHSYNDFVSPIMNVSSNISNYTYSSLFSQMLNYSFVEGYRLVSTNNVLISDELNSKNYDVRFVGAPTSRAINEETITAKNGEETTAYVTDRSDYYCYFYRDKSNTYNQNTFLYISDVLADNLLIDYNLSSYEELIGKTFSFNSDNSEQEETSFSLAIDNIIYSDYGNAPRIREIYGDNFGFTSFIATSNKNEYLLNHFEMDLKLNPYGNKTTFELVNDVCPISDYTISFSLYDYKLNEYYNNSSLDETYINSFSSTSNLYLFIAFFSIIIVGFAFFSLSYFTKIFPFSPKLTFIFDLIVIGGFVIYGVVANFIYIYSLHTLFVLLVLFVLILCNRKEAICGAKKCFKHKNKNSDTKTENQEFISIEI